jgi:ubiquinone/menaquinone biosynthesis C-methylase UbiE
MNLLKMKGAWGTLSGAIYESVVARGCEPLYQRFAATAVSDLPHGARVLDVGCGGGHVTRILAQRFSGCQVTGMDLSPAQVQRARERYGGTLPNLSFRQGDALGLPLEDRCVDLVTCVASIKHWPDRLAGLREIHRVLVPGGTVCILEADQRASLEACRTFVGYWRHVMPGTRGMVARYFRRVVAGQALGLVQLRELMQEAGFSAIEAMQVDGQPFVAARAIRP